MKHYTSRSAETGDQRTSGAARRGAQPGAEAAGERGEEQVRRKNTWGGEPAAEAGAAEAPAQRTRRTHLHAELVALEELPAGVPAALALEELLGEPAVEALVVLALQLGARLAHAVHRGGPAPARALSPGRPRRRSDALPARGGDVAGHRRWGAMRALRLCRWLRTAPGVARGAGEGRLPTPRAPPARAASPAPVPPRPAWQHGEQRPPPQVAPGGEREGRETRPGRLFLPAPLCPGPSCRNECLPRLGRE